MCLRGMATTRRRIPNNALNSRSTDLLANLTPVNSLWQAKVVLKVVVKAVVMVVGVHAVRWMLWLW